MGCEQNKCKVSVNDADATCKFLADKLQSSDNSITFNSVNLGGGTYILDLLATAGAGINVVTTNYANLLNLYNTNNLVVGFYKFTFHTVTRILGDLSSSHIGADETLIVFATSPSTFSKQAWSADYPDDILEWSIVDSTSANTPINVASTGIITYRRNAVQNIAKHYDFREVPFYKPVSTYDMSAVVFPITPTSIVKGATTYNFAPTTFASLEEIAYFFNKGSYGLLYSPATFNPVSGTLIIWATDGQALGDFVFDDSSPGTITATPTVNTDLWYSFGNTIQFYSSALPNPALTPAADGHQISSHRDVFVGKTSDLWWGWCQDNTVFGTGASLIMRGDECTYEHFGDDSTSHKADGQNFGNAINNVCTASDMEQGASGHFLSPGVFNVKYGLNSFFVFIDETNDTSTFGELVGVCSVRKSCYDITIGKYNSDIIIGDNSGGVVIGDGAQQSVGFPITIPASTTNKHLSIGFSDFECTINPDVSFIVDTIGNEYCGVIKMADDANPVVNKIFLYTSNHPVTLYPLASQTFSIRDASFSAGNIYLEIAGTVAFRGDFEDTMTVIRGRNNPVKTVKINLTNPATS